MNRVRIASHSLKIAQRLFEPRNFAQLAIRQRHRDVVHNWGGGNVVWDANKKRSDPIGVVEAVPYRLLQPVPHLATVIGDEVNKRRQTLGGGERHAVFDLVALLKLLSRKHDGTPAVAHNQQIGLSARHHLVVPNNPQKIVSARLAAQAAELFHKQTVANQRRRLDHSVLPERFGCDERTSVPDATARRRVDHEPHRVENCQSAHVYHPQQHGKAIECQLRQGTVGKAIKNECDSLPVRLIETPNNLFLLAPNLHRCKFGIAGRSNSSGGASSRCSSSTMSLYVVVSMSCTANMRIVINRMPA